MSLVRMRRKRSGPLRRVLRFIGRVLFVLLASITPVPPPIPPPPPQTTQLISESAEDDEDR